MSEERDKDVFVWRMVFIGFLFVLSLFLLGKQLHRIQIVESRAYTSSQQRQSVRRVLLPAPRGRIFDREGFCMADNRPSYCIAFFVEEMRKPGRWKNTIDAVDARIDELSLKLKIPRQISRKDIERHVFRQLPLPLLAWQNVSEDVLARFSEMITSDSGMDVYVQPERYYPLGKASAHLLGYVGRDKPVSPTNEVTHYNVMGMKGRSGVELARNETLSGVPGGKLITVDVSGYRHSETNRPPIPGTDVHLTVSAELQELCERIVGDRKASVVAIDPRNGDLLALASTPSFDPNDMSPAVPTALWKQLQADSRTPLLNRAVTGVYPPGSTFKPAVALAALSAGVPSSVKFDCSGVYSLGLMKLRCAVRHGHGPDIGMRKAIEVSCNPYFCSLGVLAGIDNILPFISELGFGKRTGIKLGGEAAALLPDDGWKRRRFKGDGWRKGDTANFSIGQGYMLATPLQMAMYAGVLANGGTLFKPRLYLDEPVVVTRQLDIPKSHLDIVRGGMFDVVNAHRGGGRRARVPGIAVAAKTGTAEYGPRSNRKKHTWMIAFAPFDKPTIALAVLVEDGESGGLTAAPVVAAVLREHFGVKDIAHIEDAALSEYAQPPPENPIDSDEVQLEEEAVNED